MSYRRAVAAIVQDRSGRILVCERKSIRGAWQFPQGGIEPGETKTEALIREVLEEIGLRRNAYSIGPSKGPYRYVYPGEMKEKKYRGQSHHYFLLRLRGAKRLIAVKTKKAEFRNARWIRPEEFDLSWLPPMKRKTYRAVLRDFFGVSLKSPPIRVDAGP